MQWSMYNITWNLVTRLRRFPTVYVSTQGISAYMATGEDQPTAQDLAKDQREISIAEFFNQNEQMLGFGSRARAMVTAVKEGVDNAIDAAEEAGVLPTVTVTIESVDDDYYTVTITDNGPGITKPQVPKVFGKLLYGSRFAKRVQKRGQQGIGISAAVMYGQQTTGNPATVTSKTASADSAEYFSVGIDTDTNEPVIQESHTTTWPNDSSSGTSITIPLDATFRARSALHKYIQHTAIVNPHATIALCEPELDVEYERTVTELPVQPTEIKPHPHGIEFGTLRSLIEQSDSHSISGFLQSEFTRVGSKTADSVIDQLRDRTDGRYFRYAVPKPDATYPREAVVSRTAIPIGSEAVSTGVATPDTEATADQADVTNSQSVSFSAYVTEHVNRKPHDVTETFVKKVTTRLSELTPVAWPTVQTVVKQAADAAETECDERLGETVRLKSATAIWEFLFASRKALLYELVSQSTSERKTISDVSGFVDALHVSIEETTREHGAIRRSEISAAVSDAASVSASSISNPFGETAQNAVSEALWGSLCPSDADPPLLRTVGSDRDLASLLHQSMNATDVMAPPSNCLSPIGEDNVVSGIDKAYTADFYAGATRDASAHSGEPFLVEAGIAYGGDIEADGDIELLRFANRVPLVYKKGGCAIMSVVSNIRWNNYKLSDKGSGLPQGPVAIAVHVASTNVPFTSESKDAIASVDVVKSEIEKAVREVARDLKSHLQAQQKRQKRNEKQDKIADILPEFATKVANMKNTSTPSTEAPLAKVMNNLLLRTVDSDTPESSPRLQLQNFDDGSSFDPTVKMHTNQKPSCESLELSVTRGESQSEWVVSWSPSVSSGGKQEIPMPVAITSVIDVTVPELSDDKIVVQLN